MGRCAQLAAQAGCRFVLLDAHPAPPKPRSTIVACQAAQSGMSASLASFTPNTAAGCGQPVSAGGCDLVVEAIVDVRTPNRPCLPTCETLLPGGTGHQHTSLSVTALAAQLQHERFAGLHFFNPAPLMKVVEIVPGLRTDMAVCERLDALVRAMGHTPVRAQDTPGFIVNHAGRGTPPRPCASSRKAWPTAPRWTASLRERGRLQARPSS
jgi:3-hydroxybutyryl-CoA dehydrogenase